MRYSDIILHLKETYEDDLKRVLRDALISLKTNGVQQVNTQQILNDFSTRGINISVTELLHLLQGDPLIKDANKDTVVFSQDEPDLNDVNNPNPNGYPVKSKAEKDAETVDKMATAALNKRIKG